MNFSATRSRAVSQSTGIQSSRAAYRPRAAFEKIAPDLRASHPVGMVHKIVAVAAFHAELHPINREFLARGYPDDPPLRTFKSSGILRRSSCRPLSPPCPAFPNPTDIRSSRRRSDNGRRRFRRIRSGLPEGRIRVPAIIRVRCPRSPTPHTNRPWTSAHARTQRVQRMHLFLSTQRTGLGSALIGNRNRGAGPAGDGRHSASAIFQIRYPPDLPPRSLRRHSPRRAIPGSPSASPPNVVFRSEQQVPRIPEACRLSPGWPVPDLHQAQPAGSDRLQVRVMAERGDADSVGAGGLKNGHPLLASRIRPLIVI